MWAGKQQSELREKLVYHAQEDRRARAGSGVVGQHKRHVAIFLIACMSPGT